MLKLKSPLVVALLLPGCGPTSLPVSELRDAPAASGDATPGSVGPYTVFEQDYKLPAAENQNILVGRQTEIWARLYLPKEDAAFAHGPAPVLVFLHGNHGTCGKGENPRVDDRANYTMTGECPDGYTVTPNHRGYDYLARNMASNGYAVISINANRGITSAGGVAGDSGLNLARGRLVLSHLELLAKWNNEGGSTELAGVDLKNKLNLDQVGMMGHSRGGEGVRAAYNLYNDSGSPWPARIGPMTVRGIFEIAPVDGQTSRTLNAMNTAWNVILPMCDGDVANLQGVKPFDRMLRQREETRQLPKSTLMVWGANHNFFNTEWQESDSEGCDDHTPIFDTAQTGSDRQRQVGLAALSSFFRAHVGAQPVASLGRTFDPAFGLGAALAGITPFGRDFVMTPDASKTARLVELGEEVASPVLSSNRATTGTSEMAMHDERTGLTIDWSEAGGDVSLKFAAAGLTQLPQLATLDLSLQSLIPGHALDFSVKLLTAAGESAGVALSQARAVEGASGRNLFQTVRFPLAGFTGIALADVTGMKLVFDKSASGKIVIGGVRASVAGEAATSAPSTPVPATPEANNFLTDRRAGFRGVGQVTDAQLAQGGGARGPDDQPAAPMVQVTVQSASRFPARGELPVLHVGAKTFDLSAYGATDESTLVFSVPAQEFKGFKANDAVIVSYGTLASSTYVIDAGAIAADILQGVQ